MHLTLLTLATTDDQSIIFVVKKLECKIQEEISNTIKKHKLLLIYFIKNHSSIKKYAFINV